MLPLWPPEEASAFVIFEGNIRSFEDRSTANNRENKHQVMQENPFQTHELLRDPTWRNALNLVRDNITVPSHVQTLYRQGWYGQLEIEDFMKVLGFSRQNPACLIHAAEIADQHPSPTPAAVEQAITFMGMRLSCVVLAINHLTRQILAAKPSPLWKSLLHELITNVEIGYRFGAKVPQIGIEGGSLVGAAKTAAHGVLLVANPEAYRRWLTISRTSRQVSPFTEQELFGCEAYQIAALLLQHLGFGPDIAMGAAISTASLAKIDTKDFSQETLAWRAAFHWHAALRAGRNYPSLPVIRNFFPELKPSRKNKNVLLEVLYTEISKIRSQGSQWTWHLPRPNSSEQNVAAEHP